MLRKERLQRRPSSCTLHSCIRGDPSLRRWANNALPLSLRTRRSPPQAAIEYRGSNRTIYNNAEWLNGWSVLRPLLPASLPFFCSNSPMCASALVERRRTQPLQIRASVSLISPSLPSSPSLQSVPPPDSRRPSSSFTLLPLGAERERGTDRGGREIGWICGR